MLDERGVPYRYRDYRDEPLTAAELRTLFALLERRPADLVRRKDRAFTALGLAGNEPDEVLLAHMAEHPTLLQRPIGILGDRAVVGRPPERLLELVDSTAGG